MLESIVTLVSATALLLGSPGPAPLALAATGASHGVKRGFPFLAGILVGLSVAIIGAISGLSALFSAWPELRFSVQVAGALYILFVAYKIASSPVLSADRSGGAAAPAFLDGFVLNLLNPKAYAAFLAIFSQFRLPLAADLPGYLATGLVCLLVAAAVDFIWLCLGSVIRPVFASPKWARLLRVSLATAMVFAVVWALF